MGDWSITIRGTGQHHNNGHENDADVIAKETVDRLLAAGQNVKDAAFTSGGALVLPTTER